MKTNHLFHPVPSHSAMTLLVTAVAMALTVSTFDAFAAPPNKGVNETPVCITFFPAHSSGVAAGIRGDQPDASGATTYCYGGKIDAHIGGLTPGLHFDSNTSSKCPCRRLDFDGLSGSVCSGYTFATPASGQNSELATDINFAVDVDGDGIVDDLDGDGDPSHNDLRNLPPDSGPFPIAVRFTHYETTSQKNFWRLHYGDIFGVVAAPKTAEVTAGQDTDGDGKPDSWLIESNVGATAALSRTQNWTTVAVCELSALETPAFSMLIAR